MFKKTLVALAASALVMGAANAQLLGGLKRTVKGAVSQVTAPVLAPLIAAPAATAIEGQYIVVFRDAGSTALRNSSPAP